MTLAGRRARLRVDLGGRHGGRRLPAVGGVHLRRPSSRCARCRSWRSGCWSVGGRPRQIRVWSLAYLRFWVVKTLVRSSPLALFVGSPLYVLYLRALGAKVGRNVAIFSRNVPVCTDLLTIGDNTVIRKDSFLSCYRAHDGVIQTGAVTLGADVFVGEKTVLDIGTSMGDGAQLGHTSSLHSGQAVPAGEHWHGSPAERTEVDYRTVAPASLQRAAEGRLHARAAGEPAGGVPAAGFRGPARAVRRGPAAGPAAGLRAGGLPDRGVLRRVPGRVGGAVLRFRPGRLRPRRHRAAAAQPDHHARTGCTGSTASTTGCTG